MKQGQTNNPNGRPKGSPNKVTAKMRSAIADFLSAEFDKIQELMDEMTAKERMDCMIKLLPYVMPKFLPIQDSSPDDAQIMRVIEALKDL